MATGMGVGRGMTLLVDMDGILVDLLPYWLDQINATFGTKATPADIVKWDLHHCPVFHGIPQEQLYRHLYEPGFFSAAPVMRGAVEGIDRLLAAGHRLLVVTSPSGGQCMSEKMVWLKTNFPDISPRSVLMVPTEHKPRVAGDVLIDDNPETLDAYVRAHPGAMTAGLEYEHNKHRFDVYSDWASVVTAINEFAERKARWAAA